MPSTTETKVASSATASSVSNLTAYEKQSVKYTTLHLIFVDGKQQKYLPFVQLVFSKLDPQIKAKFRDITEFLTFFESHTLVTDRDARRLTVSTDPKSGERMITRIDRKQQAQQEQQEQHATSHTNTSLQTVRLFPPGTPNVATTTATISSSSSSSSSSSFTSTLTGTEKNRIASLAYKGIPDTTELIGYSVLMAFIWKRLDDETKLKFSEDINQLAEYFFLHSSPIANGIMALFLVPATGSKMISRVQPAGSVMAPGGMASRILTENDCLDMWAELCRHVPRNDANVATGISKAALDDQIKRTTKSAKLKKERNLRTATLEFFIQIAQFIEYCPVPTGQQQQQSGTAHTNATHVRFTELGKMQWNQKNPVYTFSTAMSEQYYAIVKVKIPRLPTGMTLSDLDKYVKKRAQSMPHFLQQDIRMRCLLHCIEKNLLEQFKTEATSGKKKKKPVDCVRFPLSTLTQAPTNSASSAQNKEEEVAVVAESSDHGSDHKTDHDDDDDEEEEEDDHQDAGTVDRETDARNADKCEAKDQGHEIVENYGNETETPSKTEVKSQQQVLEMKLENRSYPPVATTNNNNNFRPKRSRELEWVGLHYTRIFQETKLVAKIQDETEVLQNENEELDEEIEEMKRKIAELQEAKDTLRKKCERAEADI